MDSGGPGASELWLEIDITQVGTALAVTARGGQQLESSEHPPFPNAPTGAPPSSPLPTPRDMSPSVPSSPPPAPRLQLLLARAEDHRPVLAQGLEVASLQEAPRLPRVTDRLEVPTRQSADAGRNNLEAQRWGVIAPEGAVGDALLRAIAPLVEHRQQEQNAPVKTYRVPADMDTAAARQWKNQVLRAEAVPRKSAPGTC